MNTTQMAITKAIGDLRDSIKQAEGRIAALSKDLAETLPFKPADMVLCFDPSYFAPTSRVKIGIVEKQLADGWRVRVMRRTGKLRRNLTEAFLNLDNADLWTNLGRLNPCPHLHGMLKFPDAWDRWTRDATCTCCGATVKPSDDRVSLPEDQVAELYRKYDRMMAKVSEA